jgi:hypothetical protein
MFIGKYSFSKVQRRQLEQKEMDKQAEKGAHEKR